MRPESRVNIYIDATNLHKGAEALGFDIDYDKLFGWFDLKYKTSDIFLFTGFIERHVPRYLQLQKRGYAMVFKDTVTDAQGNIKGNCDTEMALKIAMDFYEKRFDTCVLVSGDGDFSCVADFLKTREKILTIVAPHNRRCSILLKRLGVPLVYLNEHYHKFSYQNEKAPDADESA